MTEKAVARVKKHAEWGAKRYKKKESTLDFVCVSQGLSPHIHLFKADEGNSLIGDGLELGEDYMLIKTPLEVIRPIKVAMLVKAKDHKLAEHAFGSGFPDLITDISDIENAEECAKWDREHPLNEHLKKLWNTASVPPLDLLKRRKDSSKFPSGW